MLPPFRISMATSDLYLSEYVLDFMIYTTISNTDKHVLKKCKTSEI